jgi:hypothetical protein
MDTVKNDILTVLSSGLSDSLKLRLVKILTEQIVEPLAEGEQTLLYDPSQNVRDDVDRVVRRFRGNASRWAGIIQSTQGYETYNPDHMSRAWATAADILQEALTK